MEKKLIKEKLINKYNNSNKIKLIKLPELLGNSTYDKPKANTIKIPKIPITTLHTERGMFFNNCLTSIDNFNRLETKYKNVPKLSCVNSFSFDSFGNRRNFNVILVNLVKTACSYI